MNWSQIAELFRLLAETMREEWRVEHPPGDALPSDAEEMECDIWCRRLADDPSIPQPVPARLQSWVFARVLIARHNAIVLSTDSRRVPGKDAMNWLLLEKWHSHGRLIWPHWASGFRAAGEKP